MINSNVDGAQRRENSAMVKPKTSRKTRKSSPSPLNIGTEPRVITRLFSPRFWVWVIVIFICLPVGLVVALFETAADPNPTIGSVVQSSGAGTDANATPRMPDGELPRELIDIELTVDGQVRYDNQTFEIAAAAGPIGAVFGRQIDMVRIKTPTPIDPAKTAELVSTLSAAGVAKHIVLGRR